MVIYLTGLALTMTLFIIVSYSQEWQDMKRRYDPVAYRVGVSLMVLLWPVTLLAAVWMVATQK